MKFIDHASNALSQLSEQFDNRRRDAGNSCGWGQFIDGTTAHTQVGPYGTSAGLIAIALARGPDAVTARAAEDLAAQWCRYRQGASDENRLFCQNPRLAWVYLALSLAGQQFQEVADEIRRELFGRQISKDRWGDWWIDSNQHDATPRRFSTALLYFCLGYSGGSGDQAQNWANTQSPLPLTSFGFPTIDVIFHTLAVLINTDSATVRSLFGKELRTRAWRQLVESRELAVYFYDFRYKNADGEIDHGREYFIVPIRLVGIVIGSLEFAPPLLKAAALSSASSVMESMRAHQGVYKEADGARASSLNQAWAAVAIKYASRMAAPRNGKALWSLVRERESIFFDRYFPFAAVSVATALVAVAPENIFSKGGTALCLLAMGWIYASKINRIIQRI